MRYAATSASSDDITIRVGIGAGLRSVSKSVSPSKEEDTLRSNWRSDAWGSC
jgi:hypothetical protein